MNSERQKEGLNRTRKLCDSRSERPTTSPWLQSVRWSHVSNVFTRQQ